MCNERNKCDDCAKGIVDTLKTIVALQKAATRISEEPETCDKKYLGNSRHHFCEFNTRPITCYGCSTNTLLKYPTKKDEVEECKSAVLRCEKVEGCTIVCRVLKECPGPGRKKYKATDSFVTINACCLGAIRCLPDTCVEF